MWGEWSGKEEYSDFRGLFSCLPGDLFGKQEDYWTGGHIAVGFQHLRDTIGALSWRQINKYHVGSDTFDAALDISIDWEGFDGEKMFERESHRNK